MEDEYNIEEFFWNEGLFGLEGDAARRLWGGEASEASKANEANENNEDIETRLFTALSRYNSESSSNNSLTTGTMKQSSLAVPHDDLVADTFTNNGRAPSEYQNESSFNNSLANGTTEQSSLAVPNDDPFADAFASSNSLANSTMEQSSLAVPNDDPFADTFADTFADAFTSNNDLSFNDDFWFNNDLSFNDDFSSNNDFSFNEGLSYKDEFNNMATNQIIGDWNGGNNDFDQSFETTANPAGLDEQESTVTPAVVTKATPITEISGVTNKVVTPAVVTPAVVTEATPNTEISGVTNKVVTPLPVSNDQIASLSPFTQATNPKMSSSQSSDNRADARDIDVTAPTRDLAGYNKNRLPQDICWIDESRFEYEAYMQAESPLHFLHAHETPGKPIILGVNGGRLRDIHFLPFKISTAVEGWQLHYWFTVDRRLRWSDILERLHFKSKPESHPKMIAEFQKRIDDFQVENNILSRLDHEFDLSQRGYEVTQRDIDAVLRLSPAQREYGVWWCVNVANKTMWQPPPKDCAADWTPDIVPLPEKRGMSERVKYILACVAMARESSKVPSPAQVTDFTAPPNNTTILSRNVGRSNSSQCSEYVAQQGTNISGQLMDRPAVQHYLQSSSGNPLASMGQAQPGRDSFENVGQEWQSYPPSYPQNLGFGPASMGQAQPGRDSFENVGQEWQSYPPSYQQDFGSGPASMGQAQFGHDSSQNVGQEWQAYPSSYQQNLASGPASMSQAQLGRDSSQNAGQEWQAYPSSYQQNLASGPASMGQAQLGRDSSQNVDQEWQAYPSSYQQNLVSTPGPGSDASQSPVPSQNWMLQAPFTTSPAVPVPSSKQLVTPTTTPNRKRGRKEDDASTTSSKKKRGPKAKEPKAPKTPKNPAVAAPGLGQPASIDLAAIASRPFFSLTIPEKWVLLGPIMAEAQAKLRLRELANQQGITLPEDRGNHPAPQPGMMGGAPVVPGYHGGATIIANNVGQVAMGSHHLAQAPVAPQANGQRGAYGSGRQAAANARWDQGMN